MNRVFRNFLIISVVVNLSGCIALAIPIAGTANLIHKSGNMVVMLEGKGDAIKVFRDAAIRAGGTIPSVTTDFARAEFSNVDIKIEAQITDMEIKSIMIRGSSLSNVGRTLETKDNIGEITEKVAMEMQAKGFSIKSKERERGI